MQNLSGIITIINYCSNDYRFIAKCIAEAKKFSEKIFVSVSDRFFDGTKENRDILDQTYFENPTVNFIEYSFSDGQLYSLYHDDVEKDTKAYRNLWHSTSRYVSYLFAKEKENEEKYILFLDADEIIEGDNFRKYLQAEEYKDYDAMRFGYNTYFFNSHTKAISIDVCGLFAKVKKLSKEVLFNEGERFFSYKNILGKKKPLLIKKDFSPYVHHYSFVRTKNELIKKVSSWGHFKDKKWKEILSKVEEGKFLDEREPFYNLKVTKTKSFFDPLKVIREKKEIKSKVFQNLQKISREDLLLKELNLEK